MTGGVNGRFSLPLRGAQALLQLDQRLDGLVREQERVDDDVLLQLVHLALDHHDRVLLAATMMSMSLFSRSANVGFATNWPSMRPTRTPASGPAHTRSEMCSAARRAGHREHVGRVLLVERDHVRDDLRVDEPALGEQRADRAIHEAADQDLRVGRAALAAEEAAGDLARRVELLLVLAGQRHEVDVARLLPSPPR